MKDDSLLRKLQELPSQDEVKQDAEGNSYIPVGRIEELLDEIFDSWDITFFSFDVREINKKWYVDGSCSLVCKKGNMMFTRKGAAMYQVNGSEGNENYAATILSLCQSNAAKKLGNRFGRSLNGRTDAVVDLQSEPKRPEPDTITRQQWQNLQNRILMIPRLKMGDAKKKEEIEKAEEKIRVLEAQFDFSHYKIKD